MIVIAGGERINLNQWERVLACVVLVTTPLIISPETVDSYLMPKYVWVGLLTAVWLLLIAARVGSLQWNASSVDWPLLALFVVFLFTVIVHYRTPLQIQGLIRFLLFAALFYLFQRVWRMGLSPVWVALALLITACLVSLYGILQDYGYDFAHAVGGVRDWRAKVIATLGNPNFLGGYLAVCLPVVLSLGLRRATCWFRFSGVFFAVFLITGCLAVTFCVGAVTGLIIALLFGVSFAIGLRVVPRFSLWKMGVLALGMFIAVGWYLFENPYNSHGRSLYREAWESSHWWSGMGARNFNWRTTRLMINDRPLTGIGFSNYLTVHEHYQGINYKIQGRAHDRDYVIPVDQPHFQLLETASETGPLGVFVMLWLFLAWMRAAIRTLRNDPHPWFAWGAFLGAIVAVGHSFSSFPFHLPATSLAVTALASYHVREVKSSTVSPSPRVYWKTAVCVFFAVILCVTGYCEFVANRYLRQGIESQGLRSVSYLERARQFYPYSHLTHFYLGIRYVEQGWMGQAENAWNQALQYQEDLTIHDYLKKLHLQQGDLEGAIHEQRRVVELNPAYPGHFRDLAALLRQAGREDEIPSMEAQARMLEKQLELE